MLMILRLTGELLCCQSCPSSLRDWSLRNCGYTSTSIIYFRLSSQHTDVTILRRLPLKVLSDLYASMDQSQVSLLASLDLPSAIDSVDHRVLIQRLRISIGLYYRRCT